MRKPRTRKITALLLTAALCAGLCTGLTANAGEADAETKSQVEQTETVPKEEISSENLTKEAGTNETEEPGTSEETGQEAVGASEKLEAESLSELSGESEVQEAENQQEGREDGQSGEAELSKETERKLSARASTAGLSDPKIEANSGMTAKQKVTWDCVWFGSYPQSEVESSDAIYHTLQNVKEWDGNNDIIVDGNRYRRIQEKDATCSVPVTDGYYNWSDSTTWHYFKYEPIKWRVLKINGSQALLLSDLALDDQKYHTVSESVTWETSTIRSWLNGYGAAFNQQRTDYSGKNFIGSAFNSGEQSAIVSTDVVNANSISFGTTGGNDTTDKVFFLSESEVYGSSAVSHGFVSDRSIYDEARRCKSSTYAKAMGAYSDTSNTYKGNCNWLLRSPGGSSSLVMYMSSGGDIGRDVYVQEERGGMRAALNLNLSSNQWSPAGTVCSDGAVDEIKIGSGNSSGNEGEIPETPKTTVGVSQITITGNSRKIAAGKKIKLTAKVSPSNASNKKVTWKSGNTKVATVDSKGVVTLKKNSGGKTVTITATAADGSGKKASYKLTSMKGIVKKVTLSGDSKKIAAGRKVKLAAKVTASKGANRTLSWKSSNTKAATVSSKGTVTLKKNSGGKTVTITAAATDGSGKKAAYKITAMKGYVKKVVISGKKTRTLKAGKTLKLKAKVTASNAKKANKTLKWTSSNKKYAAVSSTGKVKTKKAGKKKTVTITAMATDGSNKKAVVKLKLK